MNSVKNSAGQVQCLYYCKQWKREEEMRSTNQCSECYREYMRGYNRKYHLGHKEEQREYNREHYQREDRVRFKSSALTHYGGGRCACVRCGFADIRALTIDHIDGRTKSDNLRGTNLLRYLELHNYPVGYQTLCMNCQFIKMTENGEVTGYKKAVMT